MANRDITYGIRITVDVTSAVAEAGKADKAFDEVAASLDGLESAAGSAQAALTGVVSPATVAAVKAGGGAAGEAAGHVARLGLSAGQTAQAMQQLPMQFTDIFTSLASGMPPMLVLIQQGGQLKDSFGGVGAAARAMGGYVAGLVGPFTVAAAGVGVLAAAWVQGSSEAETYEKTLAATGYRAGVTAGELSAMAARIDQVAGTQGGAAEILDQLAASGKVGAGQIEEVGTAIAAMAETGASDVEALIKQFEAIGEDPVKGILKINEAYNFLTPTIYGQVKALQEQGKMEEAVALAQAEAAKGVKQRAVEVEAATGAMERGWRSLVNVVREAWDAMKNVGRESLQQQIAAQKKLIAEISAGDQVGNVEVAQRYLKTLEDQAAAERAAAEGGAARAASMKGFLAVEKDVAAVQERGARQTRSLSQALAEYRENLDKVRAADPKSVMLDPAKVAAGEAAIRKEYEKTAATRKATAATPGERLDSAWVQRIQVLRAQASATESLTETEKAAIRVMTDFANGKLKLSAAERARLPGLVQEALLLDDAAEAAKRAKAEQEALAKAQEDAIAAVRADTQALLTKLDAARFEAETYGMTEEAVYRLLAARAADRAEMNAFGDANDAVIAELKAQAKAYLELADAAGAKAGREAQRKAGEDARASAQRFSDDLERALTDSLMRSFEAGKGFGEAFLASIKNMLKTAALKTVVQVVTQPVVSSFAGASPGGVAGMPGGSAPGALGNLSTYTSYDALGQGAYSVAARFANSSIGQSWGLSTPSIGPVTDVTGAQLIPNSSAAGSLTQSGSTLASSAATAATYAGYAMAAYNGIKAFENGQYGRAIGTAVGAYFGGPIGSAIGAEVGGLLDHTPTYHSGGAYAVKTDGTMYRATNATTPDFNLGWGAYRSDRNASYDDAMLGISSALAAQITDSIKQYGGEALDITISSRFASDNSDWSEGAVRVADEFGNAVFEQSKRYTKDANKALQEFTADSARALLGALQKTDLNDEFDALFAAVDPLKASVAEINAVLERANAIAQEVASVRAAIDSNFLEPAEQLQAVFEKLGVALPVSVDGYEQLVRAQDLNSAAGRQLAASLMGVYGLWSQVEDAAKAAAQTAAEAAQRAADAQAAALMAAVTAARGDLVSAYQDEVSALDGTVSRFRSFAADLRKFRDTLSLGALSPYTPGQKYAEAARQFDVTYAAAMAGDEAASGQLQGVAQGFLEASQVYNASSDAYVADFTKVQAALSNAAISADATADVANVQLNVARDQLELLGQIDAGTKSVTVALQALSAAVLQAVAAGQNPGRGTMGALAGGTTDAWVPAANGLEVWQSLGGAAASRTAQGTMLYGLDGKAHTAAELIGYWSSGISERQIYDSAKAMGITLAELEAFMGWPRGTATRWAQDQGLPAFANGGLHQGGFRIVGERGWEVEATGPARYWTFEQSKQMLSGGGADVAAEIRALRAEVQMLREQQRSETADLIRSQYDAAARNAERVTSVRSRDEWSRATRPELA